MAHEHKNALHMQKGAGRRDSKFSAKAAIVAGALAIALTPAAALAAAPMGENAAGSQGGPAMVQVFDRMAPQDGEQPPALPNGEQPVEGELPPALPNGEQPVEGELPPALPNGEMPADGELPPTGQQRPDFARGGQPVERMTF